MFSAPRKPGMVDLAANVLDKTFKVYSFDRESGKVSDISGLDADSASRMEATWGGLAEFSEVANAEVAKAMANATTDATEEA